jgi:hypothetical protein
MAQITLQPVWEGLAQHRWSEEQLAALDAELAPIDFFVAYRLGLHADLGGQTKQMDLIRQHPLRIQDIDGEQGNTPWPGPGPSAAILLPTGWLYQAEYRSANLLVDHFLPAADGSSHTFSPAIIRRGEDLLRADAQSPWFFTWYEQVMLPDLTQTTEKFAHGQATVDLARVAVALERYRLAHGDYPETLDVLAPKFIATVPHDVIGGQPLKYHRQTDGRFVLYSVGWNETDDGGKVVLGGGTTPAVDLEKGDWVWEYPAE